MSFRDSWTNPKTWTLQGFLLCVLIIISLAQIISWIVGIFYAPANQIKLGFMFYPFLLVGLIIAFFKWIVLKKEFEKKDVLFFILVVVAVLGIIFFAKTYIPQMFSLYQDAFTPVQFREGLARAADTTTNALTTGNMTYAKQAIIAGWT